MRHFSTPVDPIDVYTQAITPAKHAALGPRLGLRFFPSEGAKSRSIHPDQDESVQKSNERAPAKAYENRSEFEGVQNGHRTVPSLRPRMQGETLRKLLILYWRPRRDSNPCYRRESVREGSIRSLFLVR